MLHSQKFARPVRAAGYINIQSTSNNTIITLSDEHGKTLAWTSAGALGFRNSRKSTTYGAQAVGEHIASLAHRLGMDVLIEVHGGEELEQALSLDNQLLGINNRNLHTFEEGLENTFDLLPFIPKDKIIHTLNDVSAMRAQQVNGFLVGEAFMRAADPGEKLRELFF